MFNQLVVNKNQRTVSINYLFGKEEFSLAIDIRAPSARLNRIGDVLETNKEARAVLRQGIYDIVEALENEGKKKWGEDTNVISLARLKTAKEYGPYDISPIVIWDKLDDNVHYKLLINVKDNNRYVLIQAGKEDLQVQREIVQKTLDNVIIKIGQMEPKDEDELNDHFEDFPEEDACECGGSCECKAPCQPKNKNETKSSGKVIPITNHPRYKKRRIQTKVRDKDK